MGYCLKVSPKKSMKCCPLPVHRFSRGGTRDFTVLSKTYCKSRSEYSGELNKVHTCSLDIPSGEDKGKVAVVSMKTGKLALPTLRADALAFTQCGVATNNPPVITKKIITPVKEEGERRIMVYFEDILHIELQGSQEEC